MTLSFLSQLRRDGRKFLSRHKKPRLCIIALYTYPLFNPQCKSAFGGSEVRTSIIAKELAKRGAFDVDLIVFDHGQPHIEIREGVRIISWPRFRGPVMLNESAGSPAILESAVPTSTLLSPVPPLNQTGLRERLQKIKRIGRRIVNQIHGHTPPFLIPFGLLIFHALKYLYYLTRKTGIWAISNVRACKAWLTEQNRKNKTRRTIFGTIGNYTIQKSWVEQFDEAHADVYMMPGNNFITGELAYYCKRRHRSYIFLAGSDMDYNADHKRFSDQMDIYGSPRHLMVYSINHASIHIAQSENQQKILYQNYGRSSFVVKNPIDPELTYKKQENPSTILWVGKSDHRVKQPELFLDLAERYPQYQYLMVLNLAISDTHERCLARARQLPNVKIIEYMEYNEIESVFAHAKLLVNTSIFEGFPNAFLQAAKYGAPIVSLQVDPGEMLTKYHCGVECSGNFDNLGVKMDQLMQDPSTYSCLSVNCREYICRMHSKDLIIGQYEDIIRYGFKRKRID